MRETKIRTLGCDIATESGGAGTAFDCPIRDAIPLSLRGVRREPAERSMELALYFVSERLGEEALFYADFALDCLLTDPRDVLSDRTVGLMRRYALVSAVVGAKEEAQIALSLGFLLLQLQTGIEADLELTFLKLIEDQYLANSARPIDRMAKAIGERVAEQRTKAFVRRGGACC